MKDWLKDLKDEYPTRRSNNAQVRLARVYGQYDDSTMQAAVDAYMLRERFFPKVGDLRPYVDAVLEAERGEDAPLEVKRQIHAARMRKLRDGIEYTDDDMYAWEVARGTMPALPDAGADDWRAGLIRVTMP